MPVFTAKLPKKNKFDDDDDEDNNILRQRHRFLTSSAGDR